MKHPEGFRARRLLALVIGCVMVFASRVEATGSTYGWEQQQVQVAPGALCTLSVYVDTPGDSLGCVECRVSFDPSRVTLIEAGEGSLFSTSGVPGLFFDNAVAPDTQSVEGCLLGYRTYALAPGELVRFVFQAGGPGVTPVRIERLRMWDIDRDLFVPMVDPTAWIIIGTTTGVGSTPPAETGLRAFPNPFNPVTTLELSVADQREAVDLTIYSASGRIVRHLFSGEVDTPTRRFEWNGTSDRGRHVSSGVYFAVLSTGNTRLVRKLVLVQ